MVEMNDVEEDGSPVYFDASEGIVVELFRGFRTYWGDHLEDIVDWRVADYRRKLCEAAYNALNALTGFGFSRLYHPGVIVLMQNVQIYTQYFCDAILLLYGAVQANEDIIHYSNAILDLENYLLNAREEDFEIAASHVGRVLKALLEDSNEFCIWYNAACSHEDANMDPLYHSVIDMFADASYVTRQFNIIFGIPNFNGPY